MSLRLYFTKKGKIEFLYKKDSTKEVDGFVSGYFSFYVDDTSVIEDSNLNDDPTEWKYFSFDVFPGLREVSFIYQKYNTEANKQMQLQIRELRVTGLDYADYECTPCTKGFSGVGSDRCSACPSNQYLQPDTGECQSCPNGTYAPEGSIAVSHS
jgi:hypothetical protein